MAGSLLDDHLTTQPFNHLIFYLQQPESRGYPFNLPSSRGDTMTGCHVLPVVSSLADLRTENPSIRLGSKRHLRQRAVQFLSVIS